MQHLDPPPPFARLSMLPFDDKGEGDRGGTEPRTRRQRKREKSAEGWRARLLREVEAVEKIVGLGVALL